MAGIFDSIRGLFGGSGRAAGGPSAPPPASEPDLYKDCAIHAEPIAEGGQWRLAGRIVTGEGEDRKEYRFVRADVFTSKPDVEAAAIRKARQIIDEQGKTIFG
ncbi:hypothetical protein DFR52_101933 [Hoeflea marina]|uniref:Transcriptional activator HlyU n=1 Tax=Hoeflea marina TaxID=274592 RepID=A0A317PSU1_9HYPH|nr:HlyU family transcriptional regulator [Hoeflea marina]PWW04239.1 hypothetical protein DFR52_101933 [Hoeflea marina]